MTAGVLIRLAVFNVFAHKVKSALVAGIIAFGTALVVAGTSLLDSVTDAMAGSVIYSLSGHLQVYDAAAKDDLALFGSMLMGADDIGHIEDFAVLDAALRTVPGVRAVVPMGLDTALVFTGNPFDRGFAALREALEAGEPEAIRAKVAHARQMIEVLAAELEGLDDIASADALEPGELEAVARARSDAFWADFDRAPLEQLEFLENRVAPLSLGERIQFFRYLGTDLDAFAEHFDRFEIVRGERVPEGRRGFLFSEFVYETINKNRVAARIDKVALARDNGRSLDEDEELQQLIVRNARQTNHILLDLDPSEGEAMESDLRAVLGDALAEGASRAEVVETFLRFEESNFDARREQFYTLVAPRIRLYQIPVGAVITLTSFGRSGYVRSVNVPVYGTFRFRALDKSALAGSFNLVDLLTFRDLYGFGSAAQQEELESLRAQAGADSVSREGAEDALFGGDAEVVVEAAPTVGFDEFAGVDMRAGADVRRQRWDATHTAADIAAGVALNAAVFLDDPSEIGQVRLAIEEAALRAGTPVRTADWQEASGLVGQFVAVTRASLYTAIFIVFLVALLIVNISTLMAALERVAEIGTMRAIGASRGFVMALVLVESVVVAVIGGAIGALVGVGVVLALGHVGIPALTDIFYFLFSGPRLYPRLSADAIGLAVAVLLVVSVLAALYPAVVASRITPRSAMGVEG